MESNYLVTQGNDLVEARHIKPLTAREQKIILTMVSLIQPSDENLKEYKISVKAFHEMLNLQGNPNYTEIKVIVENLMSKVIEIPQNGGWVLTHWVTTARYISGEGEIRLKFSPDLKPYLLQLKNQFTSYRLSNILNLKSVYAIRLYELMKKWQHLGKRTYEVEELKKKLGATTKSFERYNLFKVRVIQVAIKELNAGTDINVSFNEIKKGRKIESIEFLIRHEPEKELKLKEQAQQPKKQAKNEEVRSRLNGLADKDLYQFDQNYFSQLYEGALFIWGDKAENELAMIIEYVNVEKSVQNPLGFIKSQIQLAWEASERGEDTTFADLQPTKERTTGREEIVPDWFKERNIDNKPEKKKVYDDIEERREKLKIELNNKRRD